MKRNYYWERIPAKIVAIKKEKASLGIFRIEAVLESRESNEVEKRRFQITWVYAPSVKTSDKMYGNLLPECFFWAYEHAKEGMDVVLHHCQDDNSKYFYEC